MLKPLSDIRDRIGSLVSSLESLEKALHRVGLEALEDEVGSYGRAARVIQQDLFYYCAEETMREKEKKDESNPCLSFP